MASWAWFLLGLWIGGGIGAWVTCIFASRKVN